MSRQIQIRRGTAAEHATFTGAIGEITMDTTNNTIRVHDGTTVGGTPLAKMSEIPDLTTADYVIASQTPTAENNYTWYRKYKSGWVEQGGRFDSLANNSVRTITLPVAMLDRLSCFAQISCVQVGFSSADTLSIRISQNGTSVELYQKNTGNASMGVCWEVKGLYE